MLAGATARVGKDATHPNKRCRAVDSQLRKAYQASVLAARLSCTNSLLLVYMAGLLQDLASSVTGDELPEDEVPEMLRVVDMHIRGLAKSMRMCTTCACSWPVHGLCGPGTLSGLAVSVQCT